MSLEFIIIFFFFFDYDRFCLRGFTQSQFCLIISLYDINYSFFSQG